MTCKGRSPECRLVAGLGFAAGAASAVELLSGRLPVELLSGRLPVEVMAPLIADLIEMDREAEGLAAKILAERN
jgi:hypothetical protein